MTVVKFAQKHNLLLAVGSAGHSAPGFGARARPRKSDDRLVEVKTRYDAANLSRLNQNVEPAARLRAPS